MEEKQFDVTIIGGGIVGLSTGRALTQLAPRLRLLILDKERQLGTHQTGHNSGVIHSGIYYRPGTLKAALCIKGARAMVTYCETHGIPYRRCGKVVVATAPEELPTLEELYRRGVANGVESIALIGPEQLQELEPHATGIRALHVPTAGIVDYTQVARSFAQEIQGHGGTIQTNSQLLRLTQSNGGWILHTSQGEISSRFLLNCGGLHADRIAGLSRTKTELKIVPFRGEYYELVPSRRQLIQGLLYPVPDPRFPFLGVHFSRRIDGRVEAGPNAIVAWKREGYRKSDIRLRDLIETVTYPGFWRMAAKYWKTGLMEIHRSFSKKAFVRSLQRLVPAIKEEDLVPGGSGVRAQALDSSGKLLDDFHLIQAKGAIHVCNAPSPAATVSLAIGEFIAKAAVKQIESSSYAQTEAKT